MLDDFHFPKRQIAVAAVQRIFIELLRSKQTLLKLLRPQIVLDARSEPVEN